jgi:hypothetical protein
LPGDSSEFDLYDGRDLLRYIPVIPSPSTGEGEGGGEIAEACARIRLSPPSPPSPLKGEGAESFAVLGGCNSAFPLCKRGTEGDFAALALRTTAHGPGADGSNRGRVDRELQIQVHPRQRHQRRELLQMASADRPQQWGLKGILLSVSAETYQFLYHRPLNKYDPQLNADDHGH